MPVSIVNGFLCFCSCDVAKAKHGEDPKKASDPAAQAMKDKEKERVSGVTKTGQPAVVYGGALAALSANVSPVDSVQAAATVGRQSLQAIVDLLV